MQRPGSLIVVTLALLLLATCSDNGDKTDAAPKQDGPEADVLFCRRPPDISQCHEPPNAFSETRYFCECPGYCGGGPPTAACNVFIGDCRYFYDSCVPKTYTRCDPDAPDLVLALCGYCFFADAGMPDDCDKLSGENGNGAADSGSAH